MGVLVLIECSISEMRLSVKLRAISTNCMVFLLTRCVDFLPKLQRNQLNSLMTSFYNLSQEEI